MRRSWHYRLLLLLVLLVALGLTWTVMRKPISPASYRVERDVSVPQRADLPLERVEGWDPRLVLLNGWERSLIPRCETFSSPLGAANGAFTYNAQAFMEMNERRGGKHSGDDLNGIGGMNTDLGDPVFAAGDGLVLYSGVPSEGWGGVMILGHCLESGEIVQTFYGHLGTRYLRPGDLVGRGTRIAKLGTAKASTAAHLHFEVIESTALEAGQPGYLAAPGNRLDPAAFVDGRRASDEAFPSVLGLRDLRRPEIKVVPSPLPAGDASSNTP